MSEKKQKSTFFKKVVADETVFKQERLLEKTLAESILSSTPEKRAIVYRESYEKLHKFFLSVSGKEGLYKGSNLHRALWKQTLIGKNFGKNQKILEVGCGEGILSIAVSKLGNYVTGIDISDICILLANKNKKLFGADNVNFLRMNAVLMEFSSNMFDWIISTDLIEHLHPDDVFNHLVEAARILKTKGKYFLITPNSNYEFHAGESHLKEYSLEELKMLFMKAGFSIKVPLFHFISPLNTLVDINVKSFFEKQPITKNVLNSILGLDPIALIASKNY